MSVTRVVDVKVRGIGTCRSTLVFENLITVPNLTQVHELNMLRRLENNI